MKMSNKVYDVLKWIALVALDAVGVFYSTLSGIWGLPFGDEVLATCTALSLFIGRGNYEVVRVYLSLT